MGIGPTRGRCNKRRRRQAIPIDRDSITAEMETGCFGHRREDTSWSWGRISLVNVSGSSRSLTRFHCWEERLLTLTDLPRWAGPRLALWVCREIWLGSQGQSSCPEVGGRSLTPLSRMRGEVRQAAISYCMAHGRIEGHPCRCVSRWWWYS